MIHQVHSSAVASLSESDRLEQCKRVLLEEAAAICGLANRLDSRVIEVIECFVKCRGAIIVAGMGKSGLIGAKISATLAATGTRSFFLHPAEAQHGDLGRLGADDVALVLSNSGETEEVVTLATQMNLRGLPVVAVTASRESSLGRVASTVIELGQVAEACEWGFVPTTSATMMTALGDAIALGASRTRGFTRSDFSELHPGGALGRMAPPR